MNDPLFSQLPLPEPCQVALYIIDESLSLLQTQRNHLLEEATDMCGLPAFSVALDTFDEAFQAFLESQSCRQEGNV